MFTRWISLMVDPELERELTARARQLGISRSALLRDLIDLGLRTATTNLEDAIRSATR